MYHLNIIIKCTITVIVLGDGLGIRASLQESRVLTAVISGPASPVLAGPVFMVALKIAHVQRINNRQ